MTSSGDTLQSINFTSKYTSVRKLVQMRFIVTCFVKVFFIAVQDEIEQCSVDSAVVCSRQEFVGIR